MNDYFVPQNMLNIKEGYLADKHSHKNSPSTQSKNMETMLSVPKTPIVGEMFNLDKTIQPEMSDYLHHTFNSANTQGRGHHSHNPMFKQKLRVIDQINQKLASEFNPSILSPSINTK